MADMVDETISEGTSFQEIFNGRFKPVTGKQLGDGDNQDGAAYLVEDTKPTAEQPKELVLKAIMQGPKQPPLEFVIQEDLAGRKFAAIPFQFIPRTVMSDRSKKADYDFIVMERLGITVQKWFLYDDKSLRPTHEKAKTLIIRTYQILREIHKAGFVHNDAHKGNWALSRSDQRVLFLFDFGRSRQMGSDYGHVTRDLHEWLRLITFVYETLPDNKENNAFIKEAKKNEKKLSEYLAKAIWVNKERPDGRRFVHYTEYSLPKCEDVMTKKALKDFAGLAEKWLKIDGSPLPADTKLTRWYVCQK